MKKAHWHDKARSVFAALAQASQARELPYPDDLAGASMTVAVALHAALSSMGVNASFVAGKRDGAEHTWLEIGNAWLDGARIVSPTARGYTASRARWPSLTFHPDWHSPSAPPGPWGLERQIVNVLARALDKAPDECAHHVARSLWGSEQGREGCGNPIALVSAAAMLGHRLNESDVRALASIVRRLANGETVRGWATVRRGVLGATDRSEKKPRRS